MHDSSGSVPYEIGRGLGSLPCFGDKSSTEPPHTKGSYLKYIEI
jgi:hypothetical protein